jgi:hypothetical protein
VQENLRESLHKLLINFDELPIYAIVIEDSSISQWYFNRILPSWHRYGFYPILFPACTPKSIEGRTELNFGSYVAMHKYMKRGIMKPFALTEKACWYSHFDAWRKCIELDRPIAVIEHDALLVNPMHLVIRADLSFFDAAAMGGYVINPKAAQQLVEVVQSQGVITQPFSTIDYLSSKKNPNHNQIKYTLSVIDHARPEEQQRYATKQICNHAIGVTIDRYNSIEQNIVDLLAAARSNPQVLHIREDVSEWMAANGYPPVKIFPLIHC